jgi:hypothetical protein
MTCQRLIYFLNNQLRVRLKVLIIRVVEGFLDDKYNRQNKRVSERCSHIFTFDFCVDNADFLLVAAFKMPKGKKFSV